MLLRRQILPLVLILQLFFGQLAVPYRAYASSDASALSSDQDEILKFANGLESAEENELPKSSKDAFLLTGQSLSSSKKGAIGVYDLSALDLNLPEMMVTDLEEVTVGLTEDGSLAFTLFHQKQELGKHIISQVKPIAIARDKELLIILDQSGTYRAIDMGYAKNGLFRSPLPVIPLFTSKVDFSKLGKVQLQFLKRDQAPYVAHAQAGEGVMPLDQGKLMKAGDLIVTSESASGPLLIEELSRNVVRTQVYTAESVLSFLALRLNPEQFQVEMERLKNIPDAAQTLSAATSEVDPLVKAAILSIPEDAMTALKNRANSNLSRAQERVDQFTFQEWQTHHEALLQKALSEQTKTESITKATPKQVIARYLTPKTMKIMAALTIGGAGVYGVSEALGGNGPAWAVHFVNEVYENYLPAVLKDSAYRVTLLKSSIALGAFIPLVWGMGFLGAKKNGKGWKPAKMIAAAGMKVYAAIQLPFYHRLAALTKQKAFLNAMKLGLNPLETVTPDSAIGKELGLKTKITPAVNNPLWKAENGNQSQLKAAATQALAQEQERATTLSWMLASVVLSEEVKVDPATLAVLGDAAQDGGLAMTPEAVEQYLESPAFRKKWEQVAVELQRELTRMKDPALMASLETISPEELGRLYSIAKQTQKKIQTRGKVGQTLAAFKNRWKRFSASSLKGLATFGVAENEFLRNVEPSKFVVDQFWKQFLIDYSLAVVQMGLIGDRANLADPQALAADANGPLWTNSGHFADMFGQVRVYGISVPSSLALVYQKAADITEGSYAPIEDLSLAGTQKTESFITGFTSWAKGAANLVQADYGKIWVRKLSRVFKTIQAGYLMSTVERVFIGGQNLVDANLAYVYTLVWATWQFGWMWEPITRGNQMYQGHLAENEKIFTELKTGLGTAIRLNDPIQIGVQMEALQELYEKSTVNMPKDLASSIDDMFVQLESMKTNDIVDLKLDVAQSREQTSKLRQAIVEGDQTAIGTAKEQLMKSYRAAGADPEALAILMKLNAVSFLEFSMQKPPFAVKPHHGVEWFTTLLGAVGTTYYATSLSVDTFRQNVSWGEKIGEAAIVSAALYTGTYYFPRVWKKWVAPTAKKLQDGVCNLILNGQIRL